VLVIGDLPFLILLTVRSARADVRDPGGVRPAAGVHGRVLRGRPPLVDGACVPDVSDLLGGFGAWPDGPGPWHTRGTRTSSTIHQPRHQPPGRRPPANADATSRLRTRRGRPGRARLAPVTGSTTTYDVRAVRALFPALAAGTAHFDGPGGSQVPDAVARAVAGALTSPLANRGRVTAAERRADAIVVAARQAVADLLAADPGGVVFGRSMTQLTYDAARTLARTWRPGDEVVVSRLDHDANIRPWVHAAQDAGAVVRWADFDPATAELTVEHVVAELSPRTRLVAVTAASNLLGTRPPVPEIAGLVHDAGALLYVDGVHLTAHAAVDVTALGADFYACSPYKFLGPHCGVLVAAPALLEGLHPQKLLPSTDAVPERFELGTLPYELLAGTTAAVDVLAALDSTATGGRRERLVASMAVLSRHEDRLRLRIEEAVGALAGVTVHSRAACRTPTLLMTFAGREPEEAYEFLAGLGVNAPASSFYAVEASRRLGLGDGGGLRVGLAPYTDDGDVDRLLDGLARFLAAA
jgi:cysteine desulfurase family protein (TIGR01976 family)